MVAHRGESQHMTVKQALSLARRVTVSMNVVFLGRSAMALGAIGFVIVMVVASQTGRAILAVVSISTVAVLLGFLANEIGKVMERSSNEKLRQTYKDLYNNWVDKYETLLDDRYQDLMRRIAHHRDYQSLSEQLIRPFLTSVDELEDLAKQELDELAQTLPYFWPPYGNGDRAPSFHRSGLDGGVLHMIKAGEFAIDQMKIRTFLYSITNHRVITGWDRPESDFSDDDGNNRLRILGEPGSYDILGRTLSVTRVSNGKYEPEDIEILFENVSVFRVECDKRYVELKDSHGTIVHNDFIDHLTTIRHFEGGDWMRYFHVFTEWCWHEAARKRRRDRERLRELSEGTEQQH